MGKHFDMILFSLSSLGLSIILYIFYRSVDFVLFHFVTPSKPLQRYQRQCTRPNYALITGGNGGIGYGIALALVQQGFGVILLGRNETKLCAAAGRLREVCALHAYTKTGLDENTVLKRSKEYVRVIVLDPQTATPEDIENTLRAAIVGENLHVSILVNNVGSLPIAYPPYRDLETYSSTDIDNTINLNARFMVHLTAQMLPILASGCGDRHGGTENERRSLILNLSSGAKIGLPYQALYAATKAFNSTLSIGLHRELAVNPRTLHVDVLSVLAGDVRSQGNIAGLVAGSPDSEAYGRYIVERSDGAIRRRLKEMTPYWRHHLNFIFLSITPEWLVDKGTLEILQMKRIAMNQALSLEGQ